MLLVKPDYLIPLGFGKLSADAAERAVHVDASLFVLPPSDMMTNTQSYTAPNYVQKQRNQSEL